MKVGDIVFINQTIGCWHPPKREERGHGVVVSVEEQEPFLLLGKYLHKPNDSVEVLMECGVTKAFDVSDVEVVDESSC